LHASWYAAQGAPELDDAEAQVRDVFAAWLHAIRDGDRASILAAHADDVVMFDLVCNMYGLRDYDRTWDFFFASRTGPITFAARDVAVTAGCDVAFLSCLVRCEGTSAGTVELRLTMGFQRVDGRWLIVHEHHSVPSEDADTLPPAT